MSRQRSTHAVVSLPALDLRRRPDHRSELGSQLLLGETVRLLPAPVYAGWRLVRNEFDGYEGWVREWGIVTASAARCGRWRALATATIAVPLAVALAMPGAGVAVGPLFLGGRVIPGPRRGTSRAIELPDGRRGWVDVAVLRMEAGKPPGITERVGSLLGVPYLWGGRTPAGLDCSSFVQLVMLEQGLRLPRDARDQHAVSVALPAGSTPEEGDLAFFAARGRPVGHVGISLGGGYFAHSRGCVRIASIDEGNALCDNELRPQFRGWFRVGGGNPPGLPRSRRRHLPA